MKTKFLLYIIIFFFIILKTNASALPPSSTAIAGNDTTLCTDTLLTLSANLPDVGESGFWIIQSGNNGLFDDATLATTIFHGINNEIYTLIWNITDGIDTTSSEITITIGTPTNANAGLDQTDNSLCGITTTTLNSTLEIGETGIWTVNSGTGGSFDNNALPNTDFTGISGENYELIWTTNTTYCQSEDTVLISFYQNPTTAIAGANQDDISMCGITSTSLAANTPTIGTGSWSIISGMGASFIDSNIPTTDFSGIGDSTYVLRWTITNSPCTSSTSDVTIAFHNLPSTAIAGANQDDISMCGITSTTLAANTPINGTGSWSIISGMGASFIDSNIPTTNFSGIGDSTYVLRWTITNSPCTSSTSDVTIAFHNFPTTAIAGANQDDISMCGITNTTLAANTPIIGTGSWSIISGLGGSFIDSNIPTTDFSGIGDSTYVLRWSITNSPCSSSTSDVTIAFHNLPTTAIAGTDSIVCGNTSLNLYANNPTVSSGEWSIISGAGGSFTNPANPLTQFSGTFNTNYSLQWTIMNSPCTENSDTLNILFKDNVTTANAGNDQLSTLMCGVTSTELEANTPTVGNGIWSIISGIGGAFSDINNPTSTFSGIADNTYTLRWTIVNPPCDSSFDDVQIYFYNLPSTANAGGDETICETEFTLAGNSTAFGSGNWEILSGGGTFADSTNATSLISNLPYGATTLVWTTTNFVCITKDTVIITNDLPTTPFAGIDSTICDSSLILYANNPLIGNGHWEGVFGHSVFANINNPSTLVTELATNQNYLRWVITHNLCELSDTIIITNHKPTPANARADVSICNFDYNLNAVQPIIGSGTWTGITGGVIIDNGNLYNTHISNLKFGENKLRWKTSYLGCESVDTITITVNMIVANAGNDTTFCNNAVALKGNSPQAGSGLWTLASGSLLINNPSDSTTSLSLVGQGSHELIWTINYNGFCYNSDTVIITNSSSTTANAGPNQYICADSTIMAGNTPIVGVASWSVVSGQGSGIFANGGNPNSKVNDLRLGNNYFVWKITNGTCISRDTVLIRNNDPTSAFAGYDRTICADSIILNADATIIGSGTWSVANGSGFFEDENLSSTIVRGLNKGINKFVWTTSNNICIEQDTVIITNDLPSTPNAGVDQTICFNYLQLQANIPLIGTGRWLTTSGTGIFVADSINNTTVNGIGFGTNTYQWKTTHNSCSLTDQVVITNSLPVSVDAGEDRIVCRDFLYLSGNQPAFGTGLWSAENGDTTIIFNPITAYNARVSGLSPGNNVLRWTITRGICSISDIVVINYDSLEAIAGNDQTICYDYALLEAVVPSGGSGHWSLVGGSGTFSDSSAFNSTIEGLASGENTLRWTVTQGSCITYDEIIIQNNLPSQADAGIDQTICDSVVNLGAQFPAIGTGSWSILGGGGTLNPVDNFISHVTGLQSGLNIFLWTLENEGCFSTDSVEIFNNIGLTEPDTSYAGAYQLVCGDSTSLQANTPTHGTGQWSVMYGGGNFSDSSDPESPVTNIPANNSIFRWTVTSVDGCMRTSDVTIKNSTPQEVYAGDDRAICSYSVNMAATDFSNQWDEYAYSVQWSTVTGTGVPTQPNSLTTQITNLSQGQNIFRMNVFRNGCQLADTVVITNNMPTAPDAGDDQITNCLTNATLNGNEDLVGNGIWTTLQGHADYTDNGLHNTTISNLAEGNNVLIWTIYLANCVLQDTVVITNLIPSNAFAGNDKVVCTTDTALNATNPTFGTGRWISGNGITNVNQRNSVISGLAQGPNSFVWEVSNTQGSISCWKRDTVTITNNMPSIANAGQNIYSCEDTAQLSATNPIIGSGHWSVVSGGNPSFANSTLNNTQITNLIGDTTILKWTTQNGLCTSIDEVLIFNQPQAFAGNDTAVCNTTLLLNADSAIFGNGQWYILSGTTNITDDELYNSQINLSALGNVTLKWEIQNGSCYTRDTVVITNDNPSPAIAQNDILTCRDSSYIYANPIVVGNGLWTVLNGAGTFDNAIANSTTIRNLAPGSNKLRWKTTNNLCSLSDILFIFNEPPAFAGNDTTICSSSIVLNARNTVLGNGTWTCINASVSIYDNTMYNTPVSNLIFGINTFVWTVNHNGCISRDTVNITNNYYPDASASGINQSLCSDTATLMANIPANGTCLWEIITGSATFTSNTSVTTSVSNLDYGDNLFRLTASVNSCISYSYVTITNNKPYPANAGVDKNICGGTTILNADSAEIGIGTWSYVGSDFIDIQNNNLHNSSASSLEYGANTLIWTVENDTCSSVDTVIITNNQLSNINANIAEGNMYLCGDTLTLNAQNPPYGTTKWIVIEGSADFVDNTLYNTQIYNVSTDSLLLQWKVTNGTCISIDTVLIINNTPEINAGLDQTLCSNSTNLNASASSGTRNWETLSGSGNIVNINLGTSLINNIGFGNNSFVWHVTNNGCPQSDTVNITNNYYRNTNAGTDTSICANTYTLNATTPTSGYGKWTVQSGAGTFTDPLINNTLVSSLQQGTNIFRWTVYNNSCPSYDTVIINNFSPDIANAGVDFSVCGDSTRLNANAPILGTGVWTSTNGSPVVFSDTSQNNSIITNLEFGNNTFVWKISYYGCSPSTDTIIVRNDYYADINAGNDTIICGNKDTLNAIIPLFGTPQWTGNAGINFVNNTLNNTIVSGLILGNNTLTWSVENNGCIASDNVIIRNNTVQNINAGTNISTCSDTILAATPPTTGIGEWSLISGNANFSDNSAYNSEVSGLQQGQNVLLWTITNSGCRATDTVIVTNNNVNAANAGNDIYICVDSSQLHAIPALVGVGEWSIINGSVAFANINTATSTISNINAGINKLKWTVRNGTCISSDLVSVFYEPVAFAGNDTVICSDSLTLHARATVTGNGMWQSVPSGLLFNNTALNNSLVQNLAQGINTLVWKVNNTSCITRDTIIIINDSPDEAYIPNNIYACGDTTYLNASPVNIGSGTWSVASGSATFTDETLNNTYVWNLQPGQTKLFWETTNNACTSIDTLLIFNESGAFGGNDTAICANTNSLHAQTPVVGTGAWTYLSGSAIFANPNSNNTSVTNLAYGQNVLLWKIHNTSCYTSDTVIITNDLPYIIEAGNNQSVCVDSSILNATIPTVGTGHWEYNSGTSTISDIYNPTSPIYNLGNQQNTLTWVVENNACTLSDVVIISNDFPDVATITEDSISICSYTYQLNGNEPVVGNGVWELINGNCNIADNTLNNSDISNIQQGANILVWKISNGSCQTSDTVVVINDLPTQPIIQSLSNQYCLDSILIIANNPSIGSGIWSVANGTGTFTDSSSASTYVSDLAVGNNNVLWTISHNTCSLTDTLIIDNLFPSLISAGNNAIICSDSTMLNGTQITGSSAYWSMVSGNGSFDNNTSYFTKVRNLAQGNNIIRWTVIYNGCPNSATVTITNDNPDNPIAGVNQIVCDSIASLQAGNNQFDLGNGHWTVLTGSGYISDTTAYETEVINLTPGENIISWTLVHNSCSLSDNITITNALQSPNAGPNQNVCADSTRMIATDLALGNGTWTVANGSGHFADNSSPTSLVTELNFGQNRFIWSVEYLGCTVTDEVIITNNTPVNVNAGDDMFICGDSTTLNADNPSPGVGFWSVYSGNANIVNNNLHNTSVSELNDGANILLWAVTQGNCTAKDSVIIFNAQPYYIDAGSNDVVCDTSYRLAASAPLFGGQGSWSIYAGSGNFVNNFNYNTSVSGLSPGVNVLVWTINNQACWASDTLYLNNQRTTAFAGSDKIVFDNSTSLHANNPMFDNGVWTLYSGSGNFSSDTDFETTVSGINLGSNVYKWRVFNDYCSNSDNVTVTRYIYPDSNFDVDTARGCTPFTVDFSNLSSNALHYLWEFGDDSISYNVNPTHTFVEEGVYNVVLKCLAPDSSYAHSDTLVINVYPLPIANFTVAPDEVFIPEQTLHCNDQSIDATRYKWDFGDGVTSTLQHPNHLYTETGIYSVQLIVWSNNMCTDTMIANDAVTVNESGIIKFPSAFRPSLEGSSGGAYDYSEYFNNSVFYPIRFGIAEYELKIFDRWGIIVFQTNDINVGWDGYINNRIANEGVYVWMAKGVFNNGTTYNKIGDVTIVY